MVRSDSSSRIWIDVPGFLLRRRQGTDLSRYTAHTATEESVPLGWTRNLATRCPWANAFDSFNIRRTGGSRKAMWHDNNGRKDDDVVKDRTYPRPDGDSSSGSEYPNTLALEAVFI